MLRALAKVWAKLRYLWEHEVAAAKSDINASLSAKLAAEKRALVAQLTKEADVIEENIKKVEAEDAGKQITLKDKYDSDRERHEAEKIVESKRQTAAAEAENASGGEKTVKYFRDQAANARVVADKIRQL
jgi:hypothetical protein